MIFNALRKNIVMETAEYSRSTYVCWPRWYGVQSATLPFGRIRISHGQIFVGIFSWGYTLRKSDIARLELTSVISHGIFFHQSLLGKRRFVRITPRGKVFPEWLAFLSNEEDVRILKEYGYPLTGFDKEDIGHSEMAFQYLIFALVVGLVVGFISSSQMLEQAGTDNPYIWGLIGLMLTMGIVSQIFGNFRQRK
jgi:hypothetical protein